MGKKLSLGFVAVLAAAFPAAGQSVEKVGKSETLDVATWNIEWFGSTNAGQGPSNVTLQREHVETIIRDSGIDLWALQEISDSGQFRRLVDSLGVPWSGFIATTQVTQRLAYIYNSDVVRVVGNPKHILEQYATGPSPPNGTNYFASRPPLELEFDAVLPDTTVRMNIITLHMKCCADGLSYERRTKAAERLKIHIDWTALQSEPVIVAGDFNDLVIGSIWSGDSPYKIFSDDVANFQFLTLPLHQNKLNTYCGNNSACATGSTIDHILITDELFPYYVDLSSNRMESLLTDIPNYVFSTSDHLPVYTQFRFPKSTSTQDLASAPESFRIASIYPNPVTHEASVRFESNSPLPTTLEVYDVLGRVHFTRTISDPGIGIGELSLTTENLAPGIYFLKITSGPAFDISRFVKIGE